MHAPTHCDVSPEKEKRDLIRRSAVLAQLRKQRDVLVNATASSIAQGGVLELDRAIAAIEGME